MVAAKGLFESTAGYHSPPTTRTIAKLAISHGEKGESDDEDGVDEFDDDDDDDG